MALVRLIYLGFLENFGPSHLYIFSDIFAYFSFVLSKIDRAISGAYQLSILDQKNEKYAKVYKII